MECADSALWTLAMTGLDSSLVGEGEVLHWLVRNISGNDLATGETLCQYKAFPPLSSGYRMFAFVLFREEERLDYSGEKR